MSRCLQHSDLSSLGVAYDKCCLGVFIFQLPECDWMHSSVRQFVLSRKLRRRKTDGSCVHINTLRPRQNGRHFADDIFKCIFLNENVWISIGISLKFVPRGPINNIPALVQIMAWRQSGYKPLSEPMMSILLTHIYVTRPQWVNWWCKVPVRYYMHDLTPYQ